MGHSHHGHGHAHPEDLGDKRIAAAVGVNLFLTVAQIVGGVLSGSLALIADGIHNLSDAGSLFIAFAARKIARKPANPDMSFGYARAEVVAALINYTTLIAIGIYLAFEGIMRLFAPEPVQGWTVVVLAGVALIVDLVTAALTFAMSKNSVNIRAAFLHNVADALGSVAVIFAGVVIILYDWRLADPIVTIGISGYILWMSFKEIGGVIRILMLGAPEDLDTGRIVNELTKIDGVAEVHHVHLWMMSEHDTGLDAHLVIEPGQWGRADAIKAAVKAHLTDAFSISHSTLELECSNHICEGECLTGHAHLHVH